MPFVRLALVRYQPNALDEAKISKVALGEFAQVLPRRRATFQQTGAQVAFSLRGTVPEHGPMQFPLDSEYQDISFVPLPGQATETGRNRVELVLQTRDPAIASDLAWSDLSVLASNVVAPASVSPGRVVVPAGAITSATRKSKAAATAHGLSQRIDLAAAVNVGTVVAASQPSAAGAVVATPGPVVQIDPPIWQTTVTLPNVSGKPARLAVREYERYYTDRTVPEVRAGATRRRRVVEERLVYTAFFNL
jgi:hypothetical protein